MGRSRKAVCSQEHRRFESSRFRQPKTKMTNENIKIRVDNSIEWKIEGPDLMPKTTSWFWALGILALAFIVFAILLKNYLLIIILALAAFIVFSSKNKRPELINFRLDNDGLYIEHKLYSYDSFESFWIFEAHTDKERELALRSKRHLAPLLIVPLYSDDEPRIRKILTKYLTESKEQESLIDLLRKRFF